MLKEVNVNVKSNSSAQKCHGQMLEQKNKKLSGTSCERLKLVRKRRIDCEEKNLHVISKSPAKVYMCIIKQEGDYCKCKTARE